VLPHTSPEGYGISLMILGHYNHLTVLRPYDLQSRSVYVIGAQGTGKSTLLETLALDEIVSGNAIVFIGNVAEILSRIPKRDQDRVVYISPSETPFALNFLSGVPVHLHSRYTNAIVDSLIGLSEFTIDPVLLNRYLGYAVQTLLAVKDTSLIETKLLFTSDEYRERVLKAIDDLIIKDFWKDYGAQKSDRRLDKADSTLSRLYAINREPCVRLCLGQAKNKLVFEDKIVLLNLKDIGDDNAKVLGALVLAYLLTQDVNTTVFVDDAKPYRTMLGKLKTGKVYSSRFIDEKLYELAQHVVAFRTSAKDAKVLTLDLHRTGSGPAMAEIPDFEAYVSEVASSEHIKTLPHQRPLTNEAAKIKKRCASQYTQPREAVEKRLAKYFGEA